MGLTDNDFVRHFQYRAAVHGHYAGRVDGDPGPVTLAALDAILPPTGPVPKGQADKPAPPPRPDPIPGPAIGPVRPIIGPKPDDIPDSGDAKLQGVHPALVMVVQEASRRLSAPFTVIEGLRTMERQRELVARGASKTLNSRHLTGHAVDLWPLDAATMRPLPSGTAEREAVLWSRLREVAAVVKAVAKERGILIEWGGDWGWDAPHFQLNRAAYPA